MERLRYLSEQSPTLNDAGILVLRVVTAVIFIRHGWGDVVEAGVSTNVENYRGAGIPIPEVSAYFTAYTQLVGGVLLAVGLLSRVAAAGMAVVMAGALIWVHAGEPIPMGQDGSGSGFALAMGAASVALLLVGPGRLSVDHLLAGRITGTSTASAASPAVSQSA